MPPLTPQSRAESPIPAKLSISQPNLSPRYSDYTTSTPFPAGAAIGICIAIVWFLLLLYACAKQASNRSRNKPKPLPPAPRPPPISYHNMLAAPPPYAASVEIETIKPAHVAGDPQDTARRGDQAPPGYGSPADAASSAVSARGGTGMTAL
jgi:hypothetical protein